MLFHLGMVLGVCVAFGFAILRYANETCLPHFNDEGSDSFPE
jgi:hypothetical protein